VGEARPIVAGSFLVFSSQVSPDGRFVAVTNRGGQEDLFVAELATGEIRQLTNDAARDRGATWSADGSKIYFYSQRDNDRYEIWSIHADGSNLSRVTTTHGRSVWYPGRRRDGKRLSFYNDENTYVDIEGEDRAAAAGTRWPASRADSVVAGRHDARRRAPRLPASPSTRSKIGSITA
jgi:Tol biopolymer transport system component